MKLLCDYWCDFRACFWHVAWEEANEWEQEKKNSLLQIADNITDFLVMLPRAKSWMCCKHWWTLKYLGILFFFNATFVI